MNNRIRSQLIEVARSRNPTISYQSLSDVCNLILNMSSQYHRNQIAEILREVAIHEHSEGRPMLTSLVIRNGDNYEGNGFFKIADESGYGDWKKLKKDGTFAVQQMNKCIEYWTNEENYNTNK